MKIVGRATIFVDDQKLDNLLLQSSDRTSGKKVKLDHCEPVSFFSGMTHWALIFDAQECLAL